MKAMCGLKFLFPKHSCVSMMILKKIIAKCNKLYSIKKVKISIIQILPFREKMHKHIVVYYNWNVWHMIETIFFLLKKHKPTNKLSQFTIYQFVPHMFCNS